MQLIAKFIFIFATALLPIISPAGNLLAGQSLRIGQALYSDDGAYVLVMQGDGNLVYYRTFDWAVRWATYTHGRGGVIAVMQGDGNLVQYDSGWAAVWNAATQFHAGAYLAAQNDGNLVIYWNGQALWNIGQDPDLIKAEPTQMGDVVGRELAGFPRFVGHVGFFDGFGVFQVMNEQPVVQYVTLDNFKATVARQGPAAYWGAGYPAIPDFYTRGCFEKDCTRNNKITVKGRHAMALRARQVYEIGARYTLTKAYSFALPRDATHLAQPGVYRCDTFVLDLYSLPTGSGETSSSGNPIQEGAAYARWLNFLSGLREAAYPATFFERLKNFRG